MGDPAGVGPELSVLAWRALAKDVPFFIVGDASVLENSIGQHSVPLKRITGPQNWDVDYLCVVDSPCPSPVVAGKGQSHTAGAIIRWIEIAFNLAQSGAASALVTNPINKAILIEGASFPHPGHTEFLAALDNKDRSVMMLASPELKVVPVTIHVALAEVPALLTTDLISATIKTTFKSLQSDFGIAAPRIAVAGLNPHAGENGLMGKEEQELVAPTLDALRAEGIDLIGPLSADTMFHPRARGSYDCAVCMYHDQALIPIKTIDFDRGVNVTLGLSVVRTSPDHGTAFDIAGKGIARPDSLIEAIKLAADMAANRAAA